DEIDTMPLGSQVKLLRVLEERSFQRIGGTKPIFADFRLIAATNADLKELVDRKLFRDDLYYRLNVITITLPELSERVSDIPLLVNHFMDHHRSRGRAQSMAPGAMDVLLKHTWPGNVRELVNTIEYAVVMSKGPQIMPADLPETIVGRSSETHETHESLSLKETERDLILKTLKGCQGNKHMAAKILRIPRSTLYSKIQKHGITVEGRSGIECLSKDRMMSEELEPPAVQDQTQQ
ncbi:MAG TPA: sigma 54-interacting transcriptional regulator, partial [Nitrospirota bacterium]